MRHVNTEPGESQHREQTSQEHFIIDTLGDHQALTLAQNETDISCYDFNIMMHVSILQLFV